VYEWPAKNTSTASIHFLRIHSTVCEKELRIVSFLQCSKSTQVPIFNITEVII